MTSSQPFTFAKQRLAKRQPGGGSMGEGTSPSRMMRSFLAAGSTDGMADSSACVYGDSGSAYSAFLGGDLHHLAQIHDAYTVGHVLHHVQAVGDEQVRQAELLFKLVQQVQHLRLDGHVQCRHRLVAHDELRVHGQGARDAHALALAARELVGVAVAHVVRQAHAL